MGNREKFFHINKDFNKAQKRRKQVYKYVQDICAGKYKDGKDIRFPLISDMANECQSWLATVGACSFVVGAVLSFEFSPKLIRQEHAQSVINSTQQTIDSAKDQVEAIRVHQQDNILQPQIDQICDKLMAKYDCLDLSDSTASSLLGDLKEAYLNSYREERLTPVSPLPHYYIVKPEYKQFYNDYSGITAELTPQITRLQEDTPIDIHTLPDPILPNDLLTLSEANVVDLVDPSIIADSQCDFLSPMIAGGVQGLFVGVMGLEAIALYFQIKDKRTAERMDDYKMATNLCLNAQKNNTEFCPANFDEFNRSFDKYITSCETEQKNMSVFEPYTHDASLSQSK